MTAASLVRNLIGKLPLVVRWSRVCVCPAKGGVDTVHTYVCFHRCPWWGPATGISVTRGA